MTGAVPLGPPFVVISAFMDQPNSNLKHRSCYKCGFQSETAETVCPQCKRPLQTSSSIRIRGFLLVICGVILMGMIGYISLWAIDAVSGTAGQSRFTGTQQEKLMIFALFGVLMIFGFLSFVTGLFQLIAGRRNKLFIWAMVVVAFLIFLGGGAVIWLFD